ncbi:hypothetical protein VV867_12400 [Pseudomonas sp. JH-2]|uniref:phage head spike fiber domain-containing protein n=1 Tax=Pseudomonas sp. JH-2 TaxID=3114998 RepID=UPI002E25D3FE|nr:hypothetical protein [Pseudomonas sp. JH-2]
MAQVSKAYADLITHTRNSAGGRFNAQGLYEMVAANQPRFDYDPVTRVLRGLLIEEQRTNLYTNSENMLTYGSLNGGLTRTASAFNMGLANFIDLIDSSNNDDFWYQNVATTPNTILCASVSVKKTVGAPHFGAIGIAYGPTIIGRSVIFNPNTGVITATSTSGVIAAGVFDHGTSWRVWMAVQMDGDTTYAGMRCYPAWNTDGSITRNNATTGTLTYGQPQIEVGSFPTSYIPTTGSQVTRAADLASVNMLSPWLNATAGTMFVEWSVIGTTYNAPVWVLQGSGTNLIRQRSDSSKPLFDIFVAATQQASIAVGAPVVAGVVRKAAGAWATDSVQAAVDGLLGTEDVTSQVPVVSQLAMGRASVTSAYFNGHLRRIRYVPRRLSNAELQAMTA